MTNAERARRLRLLADLLEEFDGKEAAEPWRDKADQVEPLTERACRIFHHAVAVGDSDHVEWEDLPFDSQSAVRGGIWALQEAGLLADQRRDMLSIRVDDARRVLRNRLDSNARDLLQGALDSDEAWKEQQR